MLAPIRRLLARDDRILVGPDTADDAGVMRFGDTALVGTVDFITPVCDDPERYGRVAAVNSLSDVYSMGGRPLFALNICCFPEKRVPTNVYTSILAGAAGAVEEAGAALLGGHSVGDKELKYGLAVVGQVDPDRVWANSRAQVGDCLVLTKPLGTGVLINAYKARKLSAAALEPALLEMERLNDAAARIGLEHEVHAATDITGFGLTGHALEIARASQAGLRLRFAELPIHDGFYDMVRKGVSTGSTASNESNVREFLQLRTELDDLEREILFDPQTSGGLLLTLPADKGEALLSDLQASGHRAARIGEVTEGPARVEVI